MILGEKGTGKSTLAETLLKNLERLDPVRILIVDSKPRFMAQWDLSGLPAKRHYKKWGMGSYWPGSYRLPLTGDFYEELQSVWRNGGKVAIAQCEDEQGMPALLACVRAFYRKYGAKIPRILYVDEQADFFEHVKAGSGLFQLIARQGRERNVTSLAGSQRPRFIPKSLLTEASRIFAFKMDYIDDVKHIWEMGLPKHLSLPQRKDHSFLFFDKDDPESEHSGKYYILGKE
jgi:hypothetical protein